MVVMAMTAIMISVTIVSLSGSRDRKAVESEARKFAAVVREAQNYALTGKQFVAGRVTCGVGIDAIDSDNEGYNVVYTYRNGASCAAGTSSGVVVTNSLSNGVTFSSTTSAFNFAVPRGEVDFSGSPRQVILSKGTDPVYSYSVCVYRTGRVEEQMGSGACPAE